MFEKLLVNIAIKLLQRLGKTLGKEIKKQKRLKVSKKLNEQKLAKLDSAVVKQERVDAAKDILNSL